MVAVRSTVFPGTCEEVVFPALEGAAAQVVSNPEFLREGCAVDDFLRPSLLVVGGPDPQAVAAVAGLYAALDVRPCLVSLRTAEMIKYACNSFHAVKIAFANEIGALCGPLGVPAVEVMETLCRDVKLNASPAYLKPGFAFGGSCLPKDLRALNYRATRLDLTLPLLESVMPSNQRQLQRAIQTVLDLPAGPIGLFGLAFKENTDDLRESPVVEMIEQLLGKGREVRIFDPHIQLDLIYGSNRNFLLSAAAARLPLAGRLARGDAGLGALRGAHAETFPGRRPAHPLERPADHRSGERPGVLAGRTRVGFHNRPSATNQTETAHAAAAISTTKVRAGELIRLSAPRSGTHTSAAASA